MKKLIIATLIATLLVGFSHQTEASGTVSAQEQGLWYGVHVVPVESTGQMQSFVHAFNQAESLDWAEVQELLNKIFKDSGHEPQPPANESQAEQKPNPEENQAANEASPELTAEEQQLVNLVNTERQKQGLAPLQVNMELVNVARIKAQDMIDNHYFDHHSPTYGSPFDMLNAFGIDYRTAGENLAGNQSVEQAHQSLMNSDGHRANILNGNYTEVGMGIVDGGPYGKMFVQLFKG